MIQFTLGWPPKELSPNARLHWGKVSRAKKIYRKACWVICLEQIQDQVIPSPGEGSNLILELEFVAPDRRSYDRDNLGARMKSGIDGMCDALKIDDKVFGTVVCTLATERIGGFVNVRIKGE
jgi:crossover junction endodeoxyribonuclease RusA